MKKIIFVLTILHWGIISFGQITLDRQVIGTTGNLTNTGLIQVFSNVGESIIATSSQGILIVTQGFEQPDKDSIVVSIKSFNDSEFQIFAYPNPTMDKVILDFKDVNENKVIIEVVNLMGHTQANSLSTNIQGNIKKEIDFRNFPSGLYYLIIRSSKGKLLKSFNIEKID